MPFAVAPSLLSLLESVMPRFPLYLILVFSGLVRAQTLTTPTAVPMAAYTDPSGEVSFKYPIVWKADTSAKFYISPHILQGGASPQAQVIFWPAGNYYAKTTLTALVFAYLKVPEPSLEACTALAVGSIPAKPDALLINGIAFQHFDTGDAGMCHGSDQHVYWTYRKSGSGGTCYLFEGDMNTSCSGAYEGQRDLTDSEKRALNRHLNAIPQSIRFH
jgi:hypothetical protein